MSLRDRNFEAIMKPSNEHEYFKRHTQHGPSVLGTLNVEIIIFKQEGSVQARLKLSCENTNIDALFQILVQKH